MSLEFISLDNVDEKYLKEESTLKFYENNSQLIALNGELLGFYTTHIILGRLTLEYNLFKCKQNQNIGTAFVNIVTELACRNNSEYDKVYLFIRNDNQKSLNVAKKNNYVLSSDSDFCSQVDEEMPGYYIYEKENEFYKKVCKKKILNNL